jgi:hypothetical protein
MSERDAVTAQTFASTFREVIRVGFNWDRFFAERWPIECVTLSTHEDLERCFMPWYIGKGGEEVAYDHPEAVPMKLTDVPKAKQILNDERQGDVEDYVELARKQEGAIEFIAPTYALPDDRYFLLDRNHRMSALALSKSPFRVTLWNVRGPLETDALLDLLHWCREAERTKR